MSREDGARLSVPVSANDHAEGPEDAAVTLVEYGDYECPHCGRAYPIVKQIQARLGSRLRFVFRNFPLTELHAHAQHAAEAAVAAGAQGRFPEMHGLLFKNQRALDDDSLVRYAAAAGLDAVRVAQELASHTHAPRVRDDFRGGVRSGVNGTPTFFINDVRHDGSWELEVLLDAIESAATAGARERSVR